MADPCYDANCDMVLAMEEAGIGVQEILQYARGVLPSEDIRTLILGLEALVEQSPAAPPAERLEVPVA